MKQFKKGSDFFSICRLIFMCNTSSFLYALRIYGFKFIECCFYEFVKLCMHMTYFMNFAYWFFTDFIFYLHEIKKFLSSSKRNKKKKKLSIQSHHSNSSSRVLSVFHKSFHLLFQIIFYDNTLLVMASNTFPLPRSSQFYY